MINEDEASPLLCIAELRAVLDKLRSCGRAQTEGDLNACGAAFTSSLASLVKPNHLSVSWGDRLLTLDKAMRFMSDPAFHRAFSEINGTYQYDQYDGTDGIAWRLNTLVWAARQALRVEGDFVELGVFRGDMSYVVCKALDWDSTGRRFHLFDTFAGFSPAFSEAGDFPDNPGFLEMAHQHYSEADLEEKVRSRFSGFSNVRINKGVVPDSLEGTAPDRIAFLHVDLNSAKAEVAALEILFERISAGGVIIFDDYGWAMFKLQRELEDAFFSRRGYQVLELPTGQGMVVR